MGKEWRLINFQASDAYTNMAIDEAIFLMREKLSLPPTLRFYSWQPPAISIGYFQKANDSLLNKYKIKKIIFVRRFTGGGAILHKDEITYSLTCSLDHFPLFKDVIKAQRIIHRAIILGLKNIGLNAKLSEKENKPDDYFCFAKPTSFDVVKEEKKIAGSAQRRKNKSFFQHGSILLNNEVLPRNIDKKEIVKNLIIGFERELKIRILPGELTKEEIELSRKLKEEKYARDEWNYKK
ncbi:lipoate--protein ligase family protein [Candidatus Aerophobetes bacterium]|nr:lipoate--protein ligase family protein [Candidatus Aerophobetes bacterium]